MSKEHSINTVKVSAIEEIRITREDGSQDHIKEGAIVVRLVPSKEEVDAEGDLVYEVRIDPGLTTKEEFKKIMFSLYQYTHSTGLRTYEIEELTAELQRRENGH